ncbi:DUF4012 domain-containing protein [Microbacterium gilvum]|uniref:DUF4012 domain-containing protein n=1 Tax=Microbacterium gilvum TaxID=1336204 RepID=A0ABP9AB47_9MICO
MPHTQDGASGAPQSRREQRRAREAAEAARAADPTQVAGFYATGIDAAATARLELGKPRGGILDRAAVTGPDDGRATASAPAASGAPAVSGAPAESGAAEPATTILPAAHETPTERLDMTRPPAEPPVPPSADGADRGRRRRRIRNGILIAVSVLLLAVVWLGARALIVKSELEAAQRVVNHIQDGGTLPVSVPILGEHAAAAAAVSVDPVWRLAEFVPWAGENLRGVRLAAEALDVVTNKIGTPALEEMAKDTDESIIARVLPLLEDSTDDVVRIADGIAAVKDSGALIPQVQTGVNLVDSVMQVAAPAFEYGPELLGANGARNYLLVFQNNAESVGLGGSAASQTLMTADSGNLAIANQASSADYQEFVPVDADVDQSAIDLYSDYLVHHINTSSSRPDFPTMADIVTRFWQRDIADDTIDGVASIDPIALGYILEATGPITLTTGDVMDSGNAAQLLLSDVYSRWNSYEDPAVVDDFFASVAEQVFAKVSTGDFDIQSMLWAINHGIEGGNILFHSSHDEVQTQIAGERVAGILPKDNVDQTTVGVFFRDESASKIDYYMKSNVDATQTCTAEGSTVQVTTTLHLDITQEAADALPDYVKSGNLDWGPTTFRTQVYVYGPPGTTVESVSVEGDEVALKRDDVVDLDRPVAWFETYLNPSELATVTATFSGEGDFGPLALRTTPMVQTTTGTVTPCG